MKSKRGSLGCPFFVHTKMSGGLLQNRKADEFTRSYTDLHTTI
jgi:hypothetical protein